LFSACAFFSSAHSNDTCYLFPSHSDVPKEISRKRHRTAAREDKGAVGSVDASTLHGSSGGALSGGVGGGVGGGGGGGGGGGVVSGFGVGGIPTSVVGFTGSEFGGVSKAQVGLSSQVASGPGPSVPLGNSVPGGMGVGAVASSRTGGQGGSSIAQPGAPAVNSQGGAGVLASSSGHPATSGFSLSAAMTSPSGVGLTSAPVGGAVPSGLGPYGDFNLFSSPGAYPAAPGAQDDFDDFDLFGGSSRPAAMSFLAPSFDQVPVAPPPSAPSAPLVPYVPVEGSSLANPVPVVPRIHLSAPMATTLLPVAAGQPPMPPSASTLVPAQAPAALASAPLGPQGASAASGIAKGERMSLHGGMACDWSTGVSPPPFSFFCCLCPSESKKGGRAHGEPSETKGRVAKSSGEGLKGVVKGVEDAALQVQESKKAVVGEPKKVAPKADLAPVAALPPWAEHIRKLLTKVRRRVEDGFFVLVFCPPCHPPAALPSRVVTG
jgi:hypothetical protein